MKPAIEVKGLSKTYEITHQQKAAYHSLRDSISEIIRRPFRGSGHYSKETFWALKDVSFEVKPGEVFAIIGRNGSGKSTLLKILSRIVEPSGGHVTLRGHTASLLEVGTGFHPELTGRENIFFNGSMLGMSKQEITRKFDEIVDFAEIEKFLDTPVKFYSSGMYVRLAFSVAAHLESDVLLLDEVLSVGDAAFQQKSLNKILSTIEEGRTVLFVSHSMGAVRQLCSRGILLKKGRVLSSGPIDGLIDDYINVVSEETPLLSLGYEWINENLVNNDYFVPQKLDIVDNQGKKIKKPVKNNEDHWFRIVAEVKNNEEIYNIGYSISNENGSLMYVSYQTDTAKTDHIKFKKGSVTLLGKIPKRLLNAGGYRIALAVAIHNKSWLFEPGTDAPFVNLVISGSMSDSPFWQHQRAGLLAPVLEWKIDK